MSEQNLSQWFLLSEQTPWEVGVYEVNSGNEWSHITYSSYWCGSKFHGGWGFPEEAYENKDHPGDGSGSKWRGLSTKPEVKNKPRNQRKQFVIVMEAAGENLERQHPVGVFEDEKNADAFLEIHQKRCPKFYYYKSWTPRFRTPE